MNQYDIYRVNFPYKEVDEEKERPALVVAVSANGISAMKITTKGKTNETHCPIISWREAGLTEESYIEYDSKVLLGKDKVIEKVGRLSLVDILRIERYLVCGKKSK